MPANNMIQYVLLNRAQYNALAVKEARTLYFIADTQELYRGSVNYSAAVVMHATGARPETGAIGKLYVNSTTGEGTVFDGTNWHVVIPAVSATVLDGSNNGVTAPVSGAAVKTYVESVAANALAQCVTAVGYDSSNKAITYTVDGTVTSVPLTKIATTLAYDGSTGVISLKDLEGTTLSSANIPLDNFITGGSYNTTTNTLDLTMQNGTTLKIPAADLVQIYHDLDSTTVNITISNTATDVSNYFVSDGQGGFVAATGTYVAGTTYYTDSTGETTVDTTGFVAAGENTIKADVKISSQADNALEVKSDGLYVPPSTTKMDKVGAGHTDEVVVADNTGNASASGYKVGGANVDTVAANRATTLATEAAVMAEKAAIEANAAATYVPLTNVVESADDIDVDNPSSALVLSEAAVVEAMSWIELTDESGNEPAEP